MRDGRIEQVGTPEEIYERPRSRWLAEFLGEADVLPGTARDGVVECELGRFGAAAELAGEVDVVIRPESVAIGLGRRASRTPRRSSSARSFYGHDQLVHLELPSGLRLRSRRLGFPAWHPGDRVRVWIDGPVSAVVRTDGAVDRAGGGGEQRLAVGVGADVGELRHAGALAADVGGAALGRPLERPQHAGAEVAVQVAARAAAAASCPGRRSRR